MDPALSALLNPEEVETEPSEPKKGKKKKKKATAILKKMQAKAAEEARNNLIKQKQEQLKQTKARVQAEWEMNHLKADVYVMEYRARERELEESSRKLEEHNELWMEYKREQRKEKEWQGYLTCNGLPSPSSMSQMNSYIFVWTELDKNDQMSHCIKKTEEVMELLNGLEEIIRDPVPNLPPYSEEDLIELRSEMRSLLQEHIDRASFYLFSRIETDMEPINVSTSKYFAKCPFFSLSLWAELYTPLPSFRGRDIRTPLKVVLEELELTVTIPVSLQEIHKVMRAMRLNYDHWSDKCRTYHCPELPFYYYQTVHDLLLTEFNTKTDIVEYRALIEKLTKKKIAALPPEPTLSQELLAWGHTPQRALSDEVVFRECEQEDNLGRKVKSMLNEFEVNLRERTVLGELLLLEILYQPPQAQCFRLKHCVTLRQEPPKLKLVHFYEPYKKPVTPEVEEDQEKKDDQKKKGEEQTTTVPEVDDNSKKLISVQFQLSQSVLWFDQPQPANWDPNHGYWSTEDIHDVNLDDEGVMTFKTGRLGLMGLHVSSYCHMPYQDWLFEPNEEGGINFYLKTSKTDLLFRIKECQVCLETMENAPGKAMNWILGKYYSLSELIEHLKKGGIDVFPAPDATTYINGVESKHIVIEKNIYHVFAMFSKTFRFKWSKFNQQADRGNIVFQAQEIYKNHQVDFCLIQIAMCSCYVLNINEESKTYSPDIVPGAEKFMDLHTFLQKNSTGHARRQVASTSFVEIQTAKELLSSIRPISFS